MPSAHSELALGELGAFELGREQLTVATEADFVFTGGGIGTLVGEALAYAALAPTGQATVALGADAVTLTEVDATGQAQASLGAMWYQDAALTVAGQANDALDSGEAVLAVMESDGSSTADFVQVTDYGFDFRAYAVVGFDTGASASSVLDVLCADDMSAAVQGVTNAECDVECVDAMDMLAESVSNTYMAASGQGNLQTIAQGVASASGLMPGAGRTSYGAQAISHTSVEYDGVSTWFADAAPIRVSSGDVAIVGAGVFDAKEYSLVYRDAVVNTAGQSVGSYIAQALWASAVRCGGLSATQLLVGLPVLRTMPRAYDVVQRLEEPRSTERPEEPRTVERVQI